MDVRRLFSEGNSVRDVLAALKESGVSKLEAVKALCHGSDLTLQEAKVCSDDFDQNHARYQDELVFDRLSLLSLAVRREYLHDFFRKAVIYGKRWLTIAPAKGGYDFWWQQRPNGTQEGSWTGESLPSLDGLAASFRMTLESQPELTDHIAMTTTDQSITLRIRLDGET